MSKEILALEKEVSILKKRLEEGDGKEASLKKSIKKLDKRITECLLLLLKKRPMKVPVMGLSILTPSLMGNMRCHTLNTTKASKKETYT